MRRLKKGAKKLLRNTLADRWRLQESINWTYRDDHGATELKSPVISVDPDDFSDEDAVLRLAATGGGREFSKNRRSGSRRVLGFFVIPHKWRRLSARQVVWRWLIDKRNVAALVSFVVHIALALILLSLAFSVRVGTIGVSVEGFSHSEVDQLDFVDESGNVLADDESFEILPETIELDSEVTSKVLLEELNRFSVTEQLAESDGARLTDEVVPIGSANSETIGAGMPFFKNVGDAAHRASRKRGNQGRVGEVTKESEDAVERGLEWLARHQLPDGGWAFDLTAQDANGRAISCQCSNSTSTSGGSAYLRQLHPSRSAATAIALLPFLGSGHTHTEPGPYQKTVASGLKYLEYHATTREEGVDFRDGFVEDGASYVQALAVLTCCEAYEMTKDANLKPLAEGGIRFIERSQLRDGGWRYSSVGDLAFHDSVAGDLSVSGWQMLALHSGVSAGFSLPASVAYRVGAFLDLVMDDNGRSYRYQPETKEDVSKRWGTTAVGVLMREYLGWTPSSNPQIKNELDRGAEQIAQWIDLADSHWQSAKKSVQTGRLNNRKIAYIKDGKLIYNLYFAYYAALALRSYGGRYWEDGYPKLRELLISTQVRSSIISLDHCEEGSWLFYDQYMNDGGRLLNTALAVLILETPYRYLPMYR